MIPEDSERKGGEGRGRIIRERSVHVPICKLRLGYEDEEIKCQEMAQRDLLNGISWLHFQTLVSRMWAYI